MPPFLRLSPKMAVRFGTLLRERARVLCRHDLAGAARELTWDLRKIGPPGQGSSFSRPIAPTSIRSNKSLPSSNTFYARLQSAHGRRLGSGSVPCSIASRQMSAKPISQTQATVLPSRITLLGRSATPEPGNAAYHDQNLCAEVHKWRDSCGAALDFRMV
jgi:hypothetical protein